MERVGSEAGDESWLVLTGDTTPLHWWLIASVDNQIQSRETDFHFTVLFHYPYYDKSLPIRISIMKQRKESPSPL